MIIHEGKDSNPKYLEDHGQKKNPEKLTSFTTMFHKVQKEVKQL